MIKINKILCDKKINKNIIINFPTSKFFYIYLLVIYNNLS